MVKHIDLKNTKTGEWSEWVLKSDYAALRELCDEMVGVVKEKAYGHRSRMEYVEANYLHDLIVKYEQFIKDKE